MLDSPELAGQKLLDALPDGALLETTSRDTGKGWKATARIEAPWDSAKPCYLARAATEDEALLKALGHCSHYWLHRERT